MLEAILRHSRAIIFDCDGTLVDTAPVYARAWAAGVRPSGREMPGWWYLERAGMSERVLMDEFESYAGVRLDRTDVVARLRAAFADELKQVREIEAVAAVARREHGRVPLAVASGGSREIVQACLQVTGLSPFFTEVVTIEDVDRAKPAPDLFLEAARRLQVPPDACVVFEDSAIGVEAAMRAGMQPVDVNQILNWPARESA